jgi:Rod binding domain-containing protein
MSNSEKDTQQTAEKKKISLADAIKQQLENKKANQASGKGGSGPINTDTSKKSQQSKKVSNQRRKTGA